MATKKPGPPIGFGRNPHHHDDSDDDGGARAPSREEQPVEPPLADPIFVDTVVQYELLKRYNLWPLTPLSAFEQQLLQVIAGLEKRIRELDPDL